MNALLDRLSLTKRFVLFLFAVIAGLLIATSLITAKVMQDGLRDLFTQRLQRSSATFDHYADVHFISKSSEIEAVVTSPRFIAAVETSDPATIANEIQHYRRLLDASVFFVEDADGRLIYGPEHSESSGEFDAIALERVKQLIQEKNTEIHTHYVFSKGELYELFHANIVTYDGLHLGRALIGQQLSGFMVHDLEPLTGFDVMVMYHSSMIAHSSSSLVSDWQSSDQVIVRSNAASETVMSTELEGREVLYLTHADEHLGVSVTFLADLDAHIAPILAQFRMLVLALAAVVGLLAMLAVYYFTSRRIGFQIDALVTATERIAGGDLNFKMIPQSSDEFGYLTKVIDNMRAKLREDLEELEQAHQQQLDSKRLVAVGNSATGIIHDFKGPMAVIRGTVELVQLKHKDDAQLKKDCDNIIQQVDHINELAQDVIEFSRGKYNLNIKPVNFRKYFSDIRTAQLAAFSQAGIDLKVPCVTDSSDSANSADLTVRLDPARFRRVVDNILNNAREALKPGQCVAIHWETLNFSLILTIKDNGPGIPEEIRETLFDPFVTSGKESGTGLGLSIAKKIIELHNSTIEVASETDVGTTFTITIPETMVTLGSETTPAILTAASPN